MPIKSAVNFCLFLTCYVLMTAPFHSTFLPLPGHDSYFLLQIAQHCPFQFSLGQ